jgi:SAM-dependent methyltransferase
LYFGHLTDKLDLILPGETMLTPSNIFLRNKLIQAGSGEDILYTSVAQVIEEIDNMPLDLQSIPQESLDLANKLRTSMFPWRGQFSPELVELFLEKYAKDTSVILDPFVGMGTTLLETSAKGIACYGAEINPSAIEMAKTVHFANIPISCRKEAIKTSEGHAQKYCSPFTWDLFSDQDQERQLPEEFDKSIGTLFKKILREARDEPLVHNILVNAIIRYMNLKPPRLASDFLLALQDHSRIIESIPYSEKECRVIHADARAIPLPDNSIDLIITSPPYINVFNYHQNNRPAMEAIGWNLLDIAKSEIGSNRKNRQNRFLTVVQYSLDMLDALREMKRLLRPDGRAIIVVGRESNIRGLSFKNGAIVAAVALGGVGFQLETRQERKFKNKFGEIIYEDILHLVPVSRNIVAGDDFARSVAVWSLIEAAETGDKQAHREALEAKARSSTVQKSPLFSTTATHNIKSC